MDMHRRTLRAFARRVFPRTVAAVAAWLLAGCAGIAPPSGGPVDTVPPAIVESSPASNQTRVRPDRIRLTFSKYVDQSSVQGAVFISPYLGAMEFSWSGTEVDITFADSLRPNTTYVVTVGTDVVDLNNRNRMAQAYSLAFSTGDSIDHGIIGGRVYDPKPEGIFIYAYLLNGLNPDTLNPMHTRPDFVTQTGNGGNFSLQYLPQGTYRVLAVRDEFKNLLYDPGTDDYGVPSRAIALDSAQRIARDVFMQMTKEDTTHLSLMSAKSLDRTHLTLRFSKNIRLGSVKPSSFRLVDSSTHRQAAVFDFLTTTPKSSSLTLVTDTLVPGDPYGVEVASLVSESGDTVPAPGLAAGFDAAAGRDTTRPRMVFFAPPDTARDVPYDQAIELRFDDAVRRDSLEKGFRLVDSTGAAVTGTFEWMSGAWVKYRPATPLRSAEWYRVQVPGTSVRDYAGNALRDSLLRRRFRTVDAAMLSSISGIVSDTTEENGRSVVLANTVPPQALPVAKAVADASGTFHLANLQEGRYVVQAFRDLNGSEVYSYGKPWPFVPSEPFAFYPDTLKLRARWPLEDVRIVIHCGGVIGCGAGAA